MSKVQSTFSSLSSPASNSNTSNFTQKVTSSSPQSLVPASPSSQAGPSSWQSTTATWKKSRSKEENDIIEATAARFASRLAEDHAAVLSPDIDSPFTDVVDVVNRLLPYHIYLNPKEDLETLTLDRKGKSKADLHSENQETRFALECFKRRQRLEARFRKARMRSGRDPFKEETVVLGQLALESDRAEMGLLHSEVRAARAELDRLERAKRATSATPRPSYYPQHTQSQPQATAPVTQPAYYRSYPFAYAQAYGATPQVPPPPTTTPYQAGVAIPVQLPVSSLPALHQLGIIPVPASTAPTSGQPAPPAVLRGSNGTMLSLEINVSLLQPNQMSGLAVILNSLMARTSTATSAASPPPSTTVSTSTPTPNASNVANNVSAGT
ncbi:hypothetical protein Moror_6322 [Moniliophthora roreri MCA 2997]|uniref:GLTSCR protein conserved domain-containing protein n=1 Tax=Moniliophthora roreri (strain MCA 2997) TaxID=1381753 RepID=V2XW49_MONRO|nr:hypothetical protein Moror_6322 [Moniliophthora roreri MCA 2997]